MLDFLFQFINFATSFSGSRLACLDEAPVDKLVKSVPRELPFWKAQRNWFILNLYHVLGALKEILTVPERLTRLRGSKILFKLSCIANKDAVMITWANS